MIPGYQDFLDAREEARDQFRRDIARQTFDQSRRGASVRRAIHRIPKRSMYGVDGSTAPIRELWRAAYAEVRKEDATRNRTMQSMTAAMVKMLLAPRKIDALLGKSSGF